MKNGKKIFILVETFLGLMVFVLVMFMFLEKNEKKQEKIYYVCYIKRFANGKYEKRKCWTSSEE